MTSVRRSLTFSFAEKYSSMAIHFVSTVILARLLTPEEIGIFAVGMAIVAMSHSFRDFGAGSYIVQERELSPARVRAAFTVTLAMAWTVAIVLLTCSALVADFYKEPGIRDVLKVLAISFFFLPFASITFAMLRRDMKFHHLFVINSLNAITHATVAVTLAWLGFGFMSLAWAAVAGTMATVLSSLFFRPSTFLLLPTTAEFRRVFSFGSQLSLISVLAELADNMPLLAGGRLLGFDITGQLNRATGFVNLFQRSIFQAIGPVAMPYFALEHRQEQDLKTAYFRAQSMVLGVAWPAFAFVFFMSYPAIRLLYGPQWDDAVPIAQVLSICMLIKIASNLNRPLFLGAGRYKDYFFMQLIVLPIQIITLPIAAYFGLMELLAALLANTMMAFCIHTAFLKRFLGFSMKEYLVFLRESAALIVFVCAPLIVLTSIVDIGPDNHFAPLIVATISAGLAWLLGLFLLKHPLWHEMTRMGVAVLDWRRAGASR